MIRVIGVIIPLIHGMNFIILTFRLFVLFLTIVPWHGFRHKCACSHKFVLEPLLFQKQTFIISEQYKNRGRSIIFFPPLGLFITKKKKKTALRDSLQLHLQPQPQWCRYWRSHRGIMGCLQMVTKPYIQPTWINHISIMQHGQRWEQHVFYFYKLCLKGRAGLILQ